MITYFIREATSTAFKKKKKIKYILHSSKATSRRTQNKTQTFQIVIKNTAQNKTDHTPKDFVLKSNRRKNTKDIKLRPKSYIYISMNGHETPKRKDFKDFKVTRQNPQPYAAFKRHSQNKSNSTMLKIIGKANINKCNLKLSRY